MKPTPILKHIHVYLSFSPSPPGALVYNIVIFCLWCRFFSSLFLPFCKGYECECGCSAERAYKTIAYPPPSFFQDCMQAHVMRSSIPSFPRALCVCVCFVACLLPSFPFNFSIEEVDSAEAVLSETRRYLCCCVSASSYFVYSFVFSQFCRVLNKRNCCSKQQVLTAGSTLNSRWVKL